MPWLLAVLLALTQTAAPSTPSLNSVVDGVDRTFGNMRDFSGDFVQIQQNSLNQKQLGTGHLYLMKPRKARYEYDKPEETLFVSDGKNVYFYVPADRQVQKGKIRDTFDDRIPLMFLVGQSHLRDEFTSFETLSVPPVMPGTMVIRMHPKRKTDLTELVMEVEPQSYLIRRLQLFRSDGSQLEFRFSNIRVNSGLKAALFDFKIPDGVRVVEGIGQ
jgi:outer membrane lipoprotein carrier protein